MGSMAASRAAPGAGASPAPTLHGWALRSCIVGLTLAVNLGVGRGLPLVAALVVNHKSMKATIS